MNTLDSSWKQVKNNYKLTQVIGIGSHGTVVKAKHRTTNEVVAIKRVDCNFKNLDYMKYILREISILR